MRVSAHFMIKDMTLPGEVRECYGVVIEHPKIVSRQ